MQEGWPRRAPRAPRAARVSCFSLAFPGGASSASLSETEWTDGSMETKRLYPNGTERHHQRHRHHQQHRHPGQL